MKDMLEIIVKYYSSNIHVFLKDGDCEWWSFYEDSDGCRDFPYDVNLDSIIERISDGLKRKLTDNENECIEEKVGAWLSSHSCEDNEYYDAE